VSIIGDESQNASRAQKYLVCDRATIWQARLALGDGQSISSYDRGYKPFSVVPDLPVSDLSAMIGSPKRQAMSVVKVRADITCAGQISLCPKCDISPINFCGCVAFLTLSPASLLASHSARKSQSVTIPTRRAAEAACVRFTTPSALKIAVM
jgi:hypothetical protein